MFSINKLDPTQVENTSHAMEEIQEITKSIRITHYAFIKITSDSGNEKEIAAAFSKEFNGMRMVYDIRGFEECKLRWESISAPDKNVIYFTTSRLNDRITEEHFNMVLNNAHEFLSSNNFKDCKFGFTCRILKPLDTGDIIIYSCGSIGHGK